MKKIWFIVIVFIVGIFNVACGSENRGVSTELLKSDIQTIDIYEENNVEFVSYEIIKQQTNLESKEDIVWVQTKGENDEFLFIRNYKLLYVLYNDGWRLELVESYSDKEHMDETLPKNRIRMEDVEAEFSFFINELAYNNAFGNCVINVICQDITHPYSEELYDSYSQHITIEYELFRRVMDISIMYYFEDNEWFMQREISEEVYLQNLSGRWEKKIDASHPMHVDSKIVLDIEQQDEYSGIYQFLKTSPVMNGNDISFEASSICNILYEGEEEFFISKIILVSHGVYGDIVIMPEGLVFDPDMSTNDPYILERIE